MSGSEQSPERPRPLVWLALLLLAVVAVYLPSLDGPLVWDDQQLIAENPAVTELQPLQSYFTRPFWETTELDIASRGYYRPLVTLSYALDFALHGGNPAGLHLTNLGLHLLNTSLLFALLRRRGHLGWSAALLSLFFALFPRQVESVAWISGRTDLLATSFVLLGFFVLSEGRLALFAAASLFLAGLLAKEVALLGFVALGLFVLGSSKRPRTERWLSLGPPALLLLGYAWLRHSVIAKDPDLGLSATGLRRLALVLEALGTHLRMLLWPFDPSLHIGSVLRPNPLMTAVGGSLLLAASVLLILALRRSNSRTALRIRLPELTLTIGPMLLVSHIVALPLLVVSADRFLYFPLAFAPLLVPATWTKRRALPVALLLWLVPSAAVAHQQAKLWAEPLALWVANCPVPRDTSPCSQLAVEESKAGNFARAMDIYQGAFRDNPKNFRIIQNGGITLARLGQLDDAYAATKRALELSPEVPKSHFDHATMAVRLGRFDDVEPLLRRALELRPNYANAREMLEWLPELREAARLLDQPEIDPFTRARALEALGLNHEVEPVWLGLLEKPTHPAQLELIASLILRDGSAPTLVRAVELLRCGTPTPQIRPELCAGLAERLGRSRRLIELRPHR